MDSLRQAHLEEGYRRVRRRMEGEGMMSLACVFISYRLYGTHALILLSSILQSPWRYPSFYTQSPALRTLAQMFEKRVTLHMSKK